jgi:hypothetical protein
VRRSFLASLIALSSLVVTVAAQRADGTLESFQSANQWFELRTAITNRSPASTRGAVAAAFNDLATAERLLHDVIRAQRASSAADDAYALLARIYIRSGQYSRFLRAARTGVCDRTEARDVTSGPGHTSRMPLMGGDCCVGNVGRDLLTQRSGFEIDFATMLSM